MRAAFGVFCALLAGCTTSQFGLMSMEDAGHLRVAREAGTADVFVVSVRNVRDVDFNGNDPQDRFKVARAALASECADIELLNESMITAGTYALGQPRITFDMRVRCRRG